MDPFLAEIVMFGGNFAPRGWAFCEGQTLPIAQNEALFSLLGTVYGGDGRTTFMLPDLRGRSPIQQGSGPGLPSYRLGQSGGAASVTLSVLEIPSHTHAATTSTTVQTAVEVKAVNEAANTSRSIDGGTLAKTASDQSIYSTNAPATALNAGTAVGTSTATSTTQVQNTGGSQAHTNMSTFLAINFIIALEGTFPSRN